MGAEGRVESGEGCLPSPEGVGSEEGAVALPIKKEFYMLN